MEIRELTIGVGLNVVAIALFGSLLMTLLSGSKWRNLLLGVFVVGVPVTVLVALSYLLQVNLFVLLWQRLF